MKRVARTPDHKPIVRIPGVVKHIVVRVEPPIVVVVFDIEHVEVAVRVSKCIACLLCHCPSSTLKAVSYSAS